MNDNLAIDLLRSFFSLFEAHLSNFKNIDGKIIGSIYWDDVPTDEQDFSFNFKTLPSPIPPHVIALCKYLTDYHLVDGDRITIPEQQLMEHLTSHDWHPEDAKNSLNFLLSIEVKMIDDGEETDSFFIHF